MSSNIAKGFQQWRGIASLRIVTVVSIVAAILNATPAAAIDRPFGTDPLAEVKKQAGNVDRCPGLTKNELAAMMLAPTWEESTAMDDGAPSPMAMSRGDFMDRNTYSFRTYDTERRAFWHPGVGMWQLDEAGKGVNLAANQRVAVPTAAKKVARVMSKGYCDPESGTPRQRRANAWFDWYACRGDSSCEQKYQDHYCAGSDSVCHIDRRDGVKNFGGMKTRICRFGADSGSQFTCWYMDFANAQGDIDGWAFAPQEGCYPGCDRQSSPLALPFYVWSDGKEIRNWITDDTPYAKEIRAKRKMGEDSAEGIEWKRAPGRPMCETSPNHRGTCS